MPRPEPVKVPLDEIRRTLEDLDRQRARDRAQRDFEATQPRTRPGRVFIDETTIQALRKSAREPVRVPLDEIRRTLSDLDRQHEEERARRRGGGKAVLPPEQIARTLSDIDRQHAEETPQRKREAGAHRTVNVPKKQLIGGE
ncbi:hypothetical protein F5883DRAFT_526554 [Diaporthe sp. PMI_573]|nr:hypothetical protein F5883DRAFT_526554 [Diaporthaceae sp. PMI_573]